ncbi:MAG: hypothetical protein KTR31_11245 [Myxococcales bacterium]|nr:hypothetical protein [Myxococcales bacterium]
MADHGFFAGLRDPEHEHPFTEAAELEALLMVERAWLQACVETGRAPIRALEAFDAEITAGRLDRHALRRGAFRDGVVVPELVRQLRAALDEQGRFLHRGATSQDIEDTALVLRLQTWADGAVEALDAASSSLAGCAVRAPGVTTMGITRMQRALPLDWSHRIEGWQRVLVGARAALLESREAVGLVQVGGPVGDRRGDLAPVAARLAELLSLRDPGYAWHSDRRPIASFASAVSQATAALGKVGADLSLLALLGAIEVEGAGHSSSMPHKRNPVTAELLVALGRRAPMHLSAITGAMLHELERSGQAWTSERWALPELCLEMTRSAELTEQLFDQLRFRIPPPSAPGGP